MSKFTFLVSVLTVITLLVVLPAEGAIFSDSFEGASLDPFWTVEVLDRYEMSFTTDPTHTGNQALALTSIYDPASDGGVDLRHYFDGPQVGEVSVWLYDHAPAVADNYVGFWVGTLGVGTAGVGIADYDSLYYRSFTQTSVPRTVGWHEWKVSIDSLGSTVYIDGMEVGYNSEITTFDCISLWGGRWYQKPSATYVFDDLHAEYVPEPTTIALFALGGFLLRGRKGA